MLSVVSVRSETICFLPHDRSPPLKTDAHLAHAMTRPGACMGARVDGGFGGHGGRVRRYGSVVASGGLPRVDEHVVEVGAGSEAVWTATVRTVRRSFSGLSVQWIARVLGCEPKGDSGWSRPVPGCSLPGFRIEAADPPVLLELVGRHRFSEYALVFRIEDRGCDTARCRAETRARFPGAGGGLYRTAVIGSRGHRLVVRRALREIKRNAERGG